MADPQRPHDAPKDTPGKNPANDPKPGEQQPGRTRPENQPGHPGERKESDDRQPAPGSQR